MANRPAGREGFEIAIICALAVEYDAISLLFDKFWDEDGDPFGKAPGDPNTYVTGCMAGFNVVLILLSNAGKASASSSAASLRSTYPRLQLVLLTGICAGVPYPACGDELLLGDVIISRNVIQYDLGRQYPDGFVVKDSIDDNLGRPTKALRNLLAVLETDLARTRLENRAATLLQRLQVISSQKQWRQAISHQYPGAAKDKLFRASYYHKHQPSTQRTCVCAQGNDDGNSWVCEESRRLSCEDLGCDKTYIVPRKRLEAKLHLERDGRIAEAQVPSIFIGRVCSGDQVLKSGEDRDSIARRYDVLAFEMEGAGIWDEAPCIIIKGISDYADSHKGKAWQKFAAATAASVTRALFEHFVHIDMHNKQSKEGLLRDSDISSPGQADLTFRWVQDLNKPITDSMEQYRVGAEQPSANTETERLFLHGFSNPDYSSESAQDSNPGHPSYDINFAFMGAGLYNGPS